MVTAVPNNKHTPDPVAGSGVQDNEALVSIDNTAFSQARRMEVALLRGLFCHPAASVVDTVDMLEPKDVLVDAHRWILRAVTEAARALVEAGEGDRKICPEVVATTLQDTGELSHGNTASALLETVTGHPPAWHDVQKLAASLRMNRLRRDVEDAGHSLVTAATGSVEVLVSTLNRLTCLKTVARRAGLEVD